MKILSLDTATEACSAALLIDGEIREQYALAPREHTKLILQMVESLLSDASLQIADLDALAFGRGPGSFTGVRIATGVVQGIAFAADLPVVAVSTLASIAQIVYEEQNQPDVLAGIDARMGGMYWGCYQLADNGLMVLTGEEQVSSPAAVKAPKQPGEQTKWCGAGSAWQSYKDQLEQSLAGQITHCFPGYYPHSSSIARLAADAYERGLAVDASQAQPVYLRNDVAKKARDQ